MLQAKPDTPLVSVIIPFLNGSKLLREAVDSVLAQTYANWQLVLIDDGSETEATTVAKEYVHRYPEKIVYTEHPGHINLGVTSSRNQGMKYAKGELIAFLDSDDVWLPEKLERQVEIYRRYPQAGFICEASKYWYSWEDQRRHDLVIPVGVEQDKLYEPPSLVYSLYPLGKGAAPCPSGVMITKTLFDQIGGFEESFKGKNQVYEDQAFLVKIYLASPVYVSSTANNLYRQRMGSLMQSIDEKKRYYKVRLFFLSWMEKYLEQKKVFDPQIHRMLLNAVQECKNPRLHLFLAKVRNKIQRLLNKQQS